MGDYLSRLRGGAVERPWYGWCLLEAAVEAKRLGHKAITVIELGVAGGKGLLCLCRHADEVENFIGIKVRVLGFDTGRGLPSTGNSLDLLYCWLPGSFEMDVDGLRKRVAGRAQILLGDVGETVRDWRGDAEAPLGAVMFDLDYYTSTRHALPILTKEHILPRVWCYMDDISGYPENAYSDSIGVRLAIREFNEEGERNRLKDHLSQAFAFKGLVPERWHEQIYVYHRLAHPDYNCCLAQEKVHIPMS